MARGKRVDYDYVIRLYDLTDTPQEAAAIAGCSYSSVVAIWRKARFRKKYTPLQKKVKALREAGKVSSEIREELGISASNISKIAEAIGLPFSEEEKERSFLMGLEKSHAKQFGDADERRAATKRFIEDNFSEWEYIDGVKRSGPVTLRCRFCGLVKEFAGETVRSSATLKCPECARLSHERAEEDRRAAAIEKQEAKKKEQERARKERFWRQDFKQIEFKTCERCGAIHTERGKFCSDLCRRRAQYARSENRVKRATQIDNSITLEKLYKRDGGTCWLCGGKCDYNDHRVDGLGVFIVGPTYPSIDHVFPLAKGGSHTWDNVRLAHHYCNTLKRDKVVV